MCARLAGCGKIGACRLLSRFEDGMMMSAALIEWTRRDRMRSSETRVMMSDDSMHATQGRFEIERDGQVSFLAYEVDGQQGISLLHTEVPAALRGRGIASELSRMAFEYAKDNDLKVEVICPVVYHFLNKHPEYKPLVRTQSPYKPGASSNSR
jgi:uncharacterized protein